MHFSSTPCKKRVRSVKFSVLTLPYISCIQVSLQSLKSSLLLKANRGSLQTKALLVWIFQVTNCQVSPVFSASHGPRSACFRHVVPATFTTNTVDTVRNFLWSTYWPSSHRWVSQAVPHFANSFNIVSVRFNFELLRDFSYIRYRYKTEWLHLPLQKKIYLGFVDNKINTAKGTSINL